MRRLNWLNARDRVWVGVLALLSAVGCLGTIVVFWPGFISSGDAMYQLQQALGNKPLSDWHPPAMSLLWRALIWITGTPASMAMVQSFMLWAALLVIAWTVWRVTASRWGSLAVLALGITPQILTFVGVVWKDTPMAFAFLAAAAIAIAGPSLRFERPSDRWLLFVVGLVFLVFAILVRKNAIFAALPVFAMLVLGLWPKPARRTWVTASAALVALLVASSLAISVLARPVHTRQQSQVMIDDLINVTSIPQLRSANVSPELRDHLVQASRKCHRLKAISNAYWRCYGYGAHGRYTAVAHADQIQSLWLREMPRHLLGYMEYRVEVFSKLLFHTRYEYSGRVVHNNLGLAIAHPKLELTLATYIKGMADDLPMLFRGWFWLLIGVVISIRPGRGVFSMPVRALALSSVIYVLGYLPILPIWIYRYVYWPAVACSLALVLAWLGHGRTADPAVDAKERRPKTRSGEVNGVGTADRAPEADATADSDQLSKAEASRRAASS